MLAAMLSDVHLRGGDDPAQRRLVGFLDALEAERLYIVGDLFHAWWGLPGPPDPAFAPALDALLRVRARGAAVTFLAGNHDPHPGPWFSEVLGARVADTLVEPLGGLRWCLAHGDQADRALSYRALRRALRSPVTAALARAVGPRGVRRVARSLAAAPLPKTGSDALIDAQRRWAAAALADGADVVVTGHAHSPGEEALAGGRWFRLGAFGEDGVWLALDPEPALRCWPG